MPISKFSVAKQYKHVQSVASDAWDIDYKIDMVPIVEVLIENNGQFEKMIPLSVERITNSHIVIHFTVPHAGVAQLIG